MRLCVVLLLVSCGAPNDAASPADTLAGRGASTSVTAVDRAGASTSAPAVDLAGAPAGVLPIRRLLRAFHAGDLPGEPALRAHDDAERSLVWISEHDELLLVRARALGSLRFYDSEATRERLLAVLLGDSHPKLIAAAVFGSGGLSPSDAELHRSLRALRTHPDPRVRRAVVRRIGEVSDAVRPAELAEP